jgi:hypothetical protein
MIVQHVINYAEKVDNIAAKQSALLYILIVKGLKITILPSYVANYVAFHVGRNSGVQALNETALFRKDLRARFLAVEAFKIPNHSIKIF